MSRGTTPSLASPVAPSVIAPSRSRRALSALLVLQGPVLLLYWTLWTTAYRLNERFEYADLLLAAYPWIGELLAVQLALLGALAPPALASYSGTVVLFMSLLGGLFGLYLAALALVCRVSRRAGLATVLATTLALQLLLLPLPGVFTTDLFSYALYGEIGGRFGGSPYVQVPDDFPTHPLYLLINPLWRDAPSVYGPVWTAIASAVGALFGGQVLAEVLAYRLIADLSHWANLALIWWTLRRLRPGGELFGLALYAWNPLVVFEFAANGHNDGTMLTSLLLCLGLLGRGHAVPAVTALVLSIATKYTTVLLLPLVLWWVTRERRWVARLFTIGATGVAALACLALLYLPWWRGPTTFSPILYWLSTPLYANYAPIGMAAWLRDQTVAWGMLSWDEAEVLAFGLQRQAVRLVFLGYLALETLRLRRVSDLPLACARALLLFLLVVNTWVLPWYYTWPLALVALGDPRSRTAWTVVGFTASAPLAMYWAQTHFEGVEFWGFVVYMAPLGALAVWAAWRRLWRWRLPWPALSASSTASVWRSSAASSPRPPDTRRR